MTNDPSTISKMLFEPIFVPVDESKDAGISFLTFPLENATLVVGFSSVLKLARFCGEQTSYVETSASELFGQLIAAQNWFGFDFEGEEGDIYDSEALGEFLVHLERDLETHEDKKIAFQPPQISDEFQSRLASELTQFKTQVKIGIVEDANGQLILAIEKSDLQNEYSLLAQIHRFISSEKERAEISMLPCEGFEALGETFQDCAVFLQAPNKEPDAPKVPNLRY